MTLTLHAHVLLSQMSSEVTARLKEATQDFKAQLPIILELGNPAMRPRHWQKLFKAMNQPYYPDLVFSLSELLDHGVAQHAELIGELSAAASGEEQLKESLVGISKARHSLTYAVEGERRWFIDVFDHVLFRARFVSKRDAVMGPAALASGLTSPGRRHFRQYYHCRPASCSPHSSKLRGPWFTILIKVFYSLLSVSRYTFYPPVRTASFTRQAWEETAFTTLNHREQPGVFILGGLEEILMVLEDNQVTLQTMMGSRFIMGVKDEVRRKNHDTRQQTKPAEDHSKVPQPFKREKTQSPGLSYIVNNQAIPGYSTATVMWC